MSSLKYNIISQLIKGPFRASQTHKNLCAHACSNNYAVWGKINHDVHRACDFNWSGRSTEETKKFADEDRDVISPSSSSPRFHILGFLMAAF